MKPNAIDELFALKALEMKVREERELREYECRDDLLAAYGQDGTDRRTSPYFGPEAGKFSVKRFKAKPGKEAEAFELEGWEAFEEWLHANSEGVFTYAFEKAEEFARWWFSTTGELPDGIARKVTVSEGTPERLSAQVYSFKPDIVLEKLAEDGNVFEGANRLLLGDGDD